jgi:predicted DNA-binding transcriptional regulator AlpA
VLKAKSKSDLLENVPEDMRVLTLAETAAMICVSHISLKRMVAKGEGPPVVQLSRRRVGIMIGDARRWLEDQKRKP